MYRLRRGWRFAAAATTVLMVVLISGCSGDKLSLIYSVVTLVADVVTTAAAAAT